MSEFDTNTILAGRVDFLVKRGDHFQEIGFLTDSDNNDVPVDLTLYAGTAVMEIKANKNDLIPIRKLSEGAGLTMEASGKITIDFFADFREGTYYYDVTGEKDGRVFTTLEGEMLVLNDVTK